MDTLLGIDIGTTGIKAVLFDVDGKILGSEYREYPLYTPSPQIAEQDPKDWISSLIECVKTLSANYPQFVENVAVIGIDGQMHTSALLDTSGNLLRRAITWMDQRSKKIVEELEVRPGRDFIFKNTLNFPTTTYLLPNLLWLKAHEPDIYKKISKILIAKDYVKYWLTHEMVTDPSDASGTLLFDVKNLIWAEEIIDYFEIDKDWFPQIRPSTDIIGKLKRDASFALGLREGIPVVNGCADHAATYIGGGLLEKREGAVIIGTAGVLSFATPKPVPDPSYRVLTWAHGIPDSWVLLGLMQTAGASLRWFRDAFSCKDDSYIRYSELANEVPPGSEGLIFLPFLMGERSPYWNPYAKGIFYGITYKHKKAHFIRAIMEGVAFGLRTILDTTGELGVEVERLRILGGGSVSKVWREIIAQILDKKIIVVQNKEQAAWGAAILGGIGVGLYDSFEEAASGKILIDEEILPGDFELYKANYNIYKELYEVLKPIYERT